MPLTDAQIERYSRQIVLPEIGGRGQVRLLESTVAIAGAGALGRTAAIYLCAAGVGRLLILPDTAAGLTDGAVLAADLVSLNPDVAVESGPHRDALSGIDIAPCDVFVAASAAPGSLAALNAVALQARRPLVAGAVTAESGWFGVFAGYLAEVPCAACWPVQSPVTADVPAGRLAASVAGAIGSFIAVEVLKRLLGDGSPMTGMRRSYDGVRTSLDLEAAAKNPGCSACRRAP